MSDYADLCVDWVMNAINSTGVFLDHVKENGDEVHKVFHVYDPAVLQELASRLNYPVCGVVYEGISPEASVADEGVSTVLGVGVLVLAESRARDVTQMADKDGITTLLDTIRRPILNKISPTNHAWRFGIEVPMDLGDRGLVYYQSWKTEVIL